MSTYLAQIAPQRSTQYADLANALAPQELALCPALQGMANLQPVSLAGQDYLKFDLPTPLDAAARRELGMLAMTSAFFDYRAALSDETGPWLRPIETGFTPAFPPDLVTTRRYKGKTNELFTHFLCNVARYSSDFAAQPWSDLRVFDPLAGGGTTLFVALMLGAQCVGIEKDTEDVKSTATFIEQYAREGGIACNVKEERLKKLGRRWWFVLGKALPRQCVLISGDTLMAAELLSNVKRSNLLVADLPYGIQHHGPLSDLLGTALPVWAESLLPGGAMALAWESTRFTREEMIGLVKSACALTVLDAPPYHQLVHRVDRVIKNRDVLVLRK
jgi:hypothetical protein